MRITSQGKPACGFKPMVGIPTSFMSFFKCLTRTRKKSYSVSLVLVVTTFLLLHINAKAQEQLLGLPSITNYTIEQYRASSNNWSIVQDSNGVMFFANHFGVLRFDGNNWQLVGQPENKTLIRSISKDSDGKIYVGCQNDFGYLHKQQNGQVGYVSLLHRIEAEDRNFADVWSIAATQKNIFFHCNDYIFCLSNEGIKTLKAKNIFQFVTTIRGRLYVLDELNGLYFFYGNNLELAPKGELLAPYQVKFLLPFMDDVLLVGTVNDGLFIYNGTELKKWDIRDNDFFVRKKINTGALLQDGSYAIGTIHDGLVILKKDGTVTFHLNKDNGLQDNLIQLVFEDKMGNLWIATDNGIDFIEISSPFSYLKNNIGVSGSVYSFCFYNNHYFAGTTKGLISGALAEQNGIRSIGNKFELFGSLSFPTWSLSIFDEELLVGNQRGTFKVKGERLYQLSEVGGWIYQPLVKNNDFLLGGSYNGLHLFVKKDDGWGYRNKIKGFTESSRVIEQEDDGTIWMAHGYKGVFRITLNEKLDSVKNVSFYDRNKGFPSSNFISVFKVRGEILFGTEKGVYYYNSTADSMVLHSYYARIFGTNEHIRKLIEGPDQEIWFIIGEEFSDKTGVLRINHDDTYRLIYTPFQRLHGKHVPGFENFYFYGNNVFVGTKDGIIRIDKSLQKNYLEPFSIVLHEVRVNKNDSLLYGTKFPVFFDDVELNRKEFSKEVDNVTLSYSHNALTFSFSAAFFIEPEKVRYSYYLEGIDNDWSSWSVNNYKEYTNLSEGRYVFRVKAKNIYGAESNTLTYSFTIKPPWYRTTFIYIAYSLIIIALLLLLNKLKNLRFQVEKKKLRLSQVKEMRLQHAENIRIKLEAENKIIQLNNEKLESELAANAIHLAQINEKIIAIRTRLVELKENSSGHIESNLNSIISGINNDLESSENWKDFLFYFNRSHQDFIHRLQETFPELTSVDIKLGALLRMNLSSKQIASLMNITLRGVEAARLRLRKKMNLEPEVNLTDFIVKF